MHTHTKHSHKLSCPTYYLHTSIINRTICRQSLPNSAITLISVEIPCFRLQGRTVSKLLSAELKFLNIVLITKTHNYGARIHVVKHALVYLFIILP